MAGAVARPYAGAMSHRAVVLVLASSILQMRAPSQHPGYKDTPMLPGGRWHVHDADRAHPPIVAPGPERPPATPPSDAIVLFDGTDLSAWRGKKGKAAWLVRDGYAEINGTGSIDTARSFGDCQLHIEWATPAVVKGESQGRGNSGVFLQSRYEVQILDSWKNATYADGQAAALYGQRPPLVNACRGPGEWQTYDIVFRAPRFDDTGALRSPATVTVLHNGVLVQDHEAFLGPTGHRRDPSYVAHGPKAPLLLQDHGNPVRFRNIWIRELPPRED
ncbi:MAG: DUF1080 domain-containing protein [Planctomycetota bacterium]